MMMIKVAATAADFAFQSRLCLSQSKLAAVRSDSKQPTRSDTKSQLANVGFDGHWFSSRV